MNREPTPPGTARLAAIELNQRALNRAARMARISVRAHVDSLWTPLTFASHDYMGLYISNNDQHAAPRYLHPLMHDLDQLFPKDLDETSVLRERFRGRNDREQMHVDSTDDYRTITVLGGEGVLRTHQGTCSIENSTVVELEKGSVIEMNNQVVSRDQELWHRVEGGMLLLVYGKYTKEH